MQRMLWIHISRTAGNSASFVKVNLFKIVASYNTFCKRFFEKRLKVTVQTTNKMFPGASLPSYDRRTQACFCSIYFLSGFCLL